MSCSPWFALTLLVAVPAYAQEITPFTFSEREGHMLRLLGRGRAGDEAPREEEQPDLTPDVAGAAGEARAAFDLACNRLFLYPPSGDASSLIAQAAAGAEAVIQKRRSYNERHAGSTGRRLVVPAGDLTARTRALWTVGLCAEALREEIQAATDVNTTQQRLALIKQHLSYKRLKRWQDRLVKTPLAASSAALVGSTGSAATGSDAQVRDDHEVWARQSVGALRTTVHERMKSHGLRQPFSASLMSGPMFTSAGDLEDGMEQEAGFAAAALAHIVWQSKHWGDEDDSRFDGSFGGKFGIQPVLLAVKPRADNSAAAGDASESAGGNGLALQHEQAVGWQIGPSLNLRLAEDIELALPFVRIGGARLLSSNLLVDPAAESPFVAVPADNRTGRTAWFWEIGTEFNLFADPLEQLHEEKGLTSPQFQFAVGFRRDSRFQRAQDLAAFASPENRFFLRFMLDAIQIVDRRQLAAEPPTFTFGFAVEYERPWGGAGARLPAATRLLVRGDTNLLKAIRGQAPAK